MKNNRALITLSLENNSVAAEGAAALADALQVNTVLIDLALGGNNIGADGSVALAKALKGNAALTKLDLSRNGLKKEGAAALADALVVNTTLTIVNLESNDIDDAGAGALADALEVNRTLVSVNLRYHSVGSSGAIALAEALQLNTSIMNFEYGNNNTAAFLQQRFRENSLHGSLSPKEVIDTVLERNRQQKLPFAQASLDLIARHSPVLKDVPADVMSVFAEQLPNEVIAVFEQEWRDAFRAPPPPITNTTTNTTTTTTTTTTTDATIPTILTTAPTPLATDTTTVPPPVIEPTATAADIKTLLDDPNPVVAFSRWIDGHANSTAALNWVDPVNGYTLLHYAVVAQQGAVIRNLLARGIDPATADKNNQTAAQLAQQRADSSSSQAVAAIAAMLQ